MTDYDLRNLARDIAAAVHRGGDPLALMLIAVGDGVGRAEAEVARLQARLAKLDAALDDLRAGESPCVDDDGTPFASARTWRLECGRLAGALDEQTKRADDAQADAVALREALSSLYDQQNGPPLLSPRHKAAWEAAMEQARSVLASPGSALLERLERLEAVVEAARIICRSWDFDSLKAALARLDGVEGGAARILVLGAASLGET